MDSIYAPTDGESGPTERLGRNPFRRMLVRKWACSSTPLGDNSFVSPSANAMTSVAIVLVVAATSGIPSSPGNRSSPPVV